MIGLTSMHMKAAIFIAEKNIIIVHDIRMYHSQESLIASQQQKYLTFLIQSTLLPPRHTPKYNFRQSRVFDLSYKTNRTKNSFINFQCNLINNNKNVY